MFNQRLKSRLFKVFISILGAFFVILFSIIFLKDEQTEGRYQSLLEENKLQMTGLNMIYVIDNGTYMNLYSEKAYADVLTKAVQMEDVRLQYTGSSINIDAKADSGKYELERMLYVYGNVSGVMNDLKFDAGENGQLIYDYKDGKGNIENGVTLYQGENNIHAVNAEFDVNRNYVLFKDNVSVDYIITE